ncbi:hypothetical protein EFL57_03405 [Weissella confusa]|uniref:hypothetical protein n=1 Tax=Weissella confusa TaxID=1583 RepID=UPI00223B18EB|nr:hypothetical protein [Weissella confusa]MCT0009527.1 hypothetical protein [Weissella confusa]
MKNKSIIFWIILSIIASFLVTTYFWLAETKVPSFVAEWVSAFGTVGAVAIALYIQFRNESIVKVQNNLNKQNVVCLTLLNDLSDIRNELNEVLVQLSNAFAKSNVSDDNTITTDEVLVLKIKASNILSKKWQLNYRLVEILNEGEQYECRLALQNMSDVVLEKINSSETISDLVSIMNSNPYQYIDEIRNIISTKYERINSLSVIRF